MISRIYSCLKTNHALAGSILLGILFFHFGMQEIHAFRAAGWPAFRWMNIFNYGDIDSTVKIWIYLKELRTGIPPVISLAEILSWRWTGSWDPVIIGGYRHAVGLMLLFPIFFTRRNWILILSWLGMAMLLLKPVLEVHKGNAQLYDVMLPCFLLLYLIFSKYSIQTQSRWLNITLAVLAGFFLSMAELTRPFMIAAVIPLLVFQFFYYRQANMKPLYWYFLIPLILFSGGWHAKLIIFNQGQIIWSNHGGSNLSNAWAPVIDHKTTRGKLKTEKPPRYENAWTWDDINTQVHAENSKLWQQAVVAGIRQNPREAWIHLQRKAAIFLAPRTEMYGYDPQGPHINRYRWLLNALYAILAFLLVRAAGIVIFSDWKYLFTLEWAIIFIAAFISFMPIIGENGEEARFMISVVPLMMVVGIIGIDWLSRYIVALPPKKLPNATMA